MNWGIVGKVEARDLCGINDSVAELVFKTENLSG